MRPALAVAIAACLTVLTGVVGCGSSGPPAEPEVALMRVDLEELILDELEAKDNETLGATGGGGLSYQRLDERYRQLFERARDKRAYAVAADVLSFWGRLYDDRQQFENARDRYLEALQYDKLAHYEARTEPNPYPNSASIATTLVNISVAHENLGDINLAADYAFRAFQINRVLGYLARLSQDCARLARLQEGLGNPERAAEFLVFKAEIDLMLAAGTTWSPMGAARGPQ